jgi:hypothetical protein
MKHWNKKIIYATLFHIFFLSCIAAACQPSYAQQLLWTRVYDTGAPDYAAGIATDSQGNIIIVGTTSPVDTNRSNFLIVKYDSSGDILWTRIHDITWADISCGVAIDKSNNIIVTGYSSGHIHIVKYESEGNILWTQIYQGVRILGPSESNCVAVDSKNNIIVTGTAMQNWGDYMTLKYDPEGNLLWVRIYDGDWEDYAHAVTVDDSDNILITGQSDSDINWDWCTVKYSPDGDTLWVRRYDRTIDDFAYGVTTDKEENVIVAGSIHHLPGGSAGTLVKYTASGDTLWTKIFTDTLQFAAIGMLVDAVTDNDANIYVAGEYARWEQAGRLWRDYYVAKLNPSGDVLWTFLYDYDGEDKMSAIALDKFGDIVVVGSTDAGIAVMEENLLTIKLRDISTGIKEIFPLPGTFILYPNYPNPFNPVTTLEYQLSDGGFVTLKVYDMLGRELETLVSEEKLAGIYTATWDAGSYAGGVYIARLTTGNFSSSIKLVLVR